MSQESLARYEAEVEHNFRWNVVVFLAYGLLGTTGWRLIMAPTFVPDYLYQLSHSNAVVGAVLFAGGLGRFFSPLVGASFAVHRPRVKRAALAIGAGLRVQVLGMALAALYLPTALNLPAFIAFYCALNVLVGFQGVVFGLLLAKVIPLARRGRFLGIRDFAGGTTAALVALLAASFLEDRPFPASYGLTYMVAFAFTALGLLCIAAIREPESPITQERRSLLAMLASMRGLLRDDRTLAWYCGARGLGALGLMAAPFFIIALGQTPGADRIDLGTASFAYFAAATTGNLLWGQVADRVGFRTVFLLGGCIWLAAIALALSPATLATTGVSLFLLMGAGQGGMQMASMNLVYEFGDDENLGVRIAVVNALGELMVALAPLGGGIVADMVSYEAMYLVAALFTMASLAVMYTKVPPRRRRNG